MPDILHSKVWDTGETLVVLEGSDVLEWLQGQVTQDVRVLDQRSSAGACFCLPTGQLEAFAVLHRMESTQVGIATNQPEVVRSRVDQYVILESVELAGEIGPVLHTLGEPPSTATWAGRSDRLGEWGWDFVDSAGPPLPRLEPSEAGLLTLEYGVPLFGVDTDEKCLPVDFGPGFERSHIAYDKGCYVGQEVLMRIHSRGRVPRLWCCLKSDVLLEPGDELRNLADQVIGRVTRSAPSPEFGLLAAAHLRVAWSSPGTRLVVQKGGTRTEAEVVPFPRRPFP